MPDEVSKNAFDQAGVWLGGGGVAALLGVLLRGFLTGALGQEKDVREGLAERVAALETKVETLEKRLDQTTRNRDAWRFACHEARIVATGLASKYGAELAPWVDPKEE